VTSPPPSVGPVIARMEAILAGLAPADGVACFARLYLDVTRGVQARLGGTAFADPSALALLDERFAELFFAAFDGSAREPAGLPRAWAPLFEARARKGIAPLQFALAGMNAHINRDLVVALVELRRAGSLSLDDGSPQHADFVRVNGVLASVEAQVKQRYLSGWLRRVDRLLHRADRIDDVVAMWDVARARDAAWTNAQALWSLRDDGTLADDYLATLDRTVGLAGRGLLVPADSWLARLGRLFGRGA
jgi:hypothetical protein